MSEIEDDYPVLMSGAALSGVELQRELVVVKPWKKKVWVQELSGAALDEYKRGNFERDGASLKLTLKEQDMRLAVLAMVDGNGTRLFPNMSKGLAHLRSIGASGTAIVAEVANRLNRQSEQDTEEMVGNSEGELTDDSTSDSPATSESL